VFELQDCRWRSGKGGLGSHLTPPHYCACLKPGHGFLS
jgi:hypothetical protein